MKKALKIKEKKVFKNKVIHGYEDYPLDNSFVIFESLKIRNKVIKEYNSVEILANYVKCFCCFISCFISAKMF